MKDKRMQYISMLKKVNSKILYLAKNKDKIKIFSVQKKDNSLPEIFYYKKL